MSAERQSRLPRTDQLVASGGGAKERPTRHTFILRLIPTFSDDPDAEPRWYGELEHRNALCHYPTEQTIDFEALTENLKLQTLKITGTPSDSKRKEHP